MKRTLLVLAGLMAAGVAMAADGGTVTFKTYNSAANNLKTVLSSGEALTADWWVGLVDASGNLLQGTKGTTLGALEPVIAGFNLTTPAAAGFMTAGGDWSVAGINQGAGANVGFVVFMSPTKDFATGAFKTYSSLYSLTFGGNDVQPPATAGKFDFAGAQVLTVTIPEPSVLALGLLGLGAFLIRRRG